MTPNHPPPKKRGGLIATVVAVLAVLAAALTTTTVYIPQQQETPAYIATGVGPPDAPLRDFNVIGYKDGTREIRSPEYEMTDHGPHAKLPDWRGSCPLGVPCAAPSMGWGVNFFNEIGLRQRPLRYCADPVRAWDAANGRNATAVAVSAVLDNFYDPPGDWAWDVLQPEEDCNRADIVLAMDATAYCGVSWGCAALLYEGGRPYVRSMVCGECALPGGSFPVDVVATLEYWVWGHENMHAMDRGHTGRYGNEIDPATGQPRRHPHCSVTGFLDWSGRPEDNLDGAPCVMDFYRADGTCCVFNWQPVQGPQPTARPTPTPQPTAAPLTKAAVLGIVSSIYWHFIEARDRAPTLGEGIANEFRAWGAADVYWALSDGLPQEALGALRQPAPPRRPQ